MQNSELGNIISRLQGLKNVNPRRVMPGEGILQENNPPAPDVEGTASQLPDFSAFLPPTQNQPESDLGGELTPQSYDIRANSVTDPEEKKEEGENMFMSALRKIGSALGDYVNPQKRQEVAAANQQSMQKARAMSSPSPAQTPPIETAQVDAQEGLPPVTSSEQASPKWWESLKGEASKPWHGETIGNALEGAKDYLSKSFTPELHPSVYEKNPSLKKPEQLVQQEQQKKELDQAEVSAAQEQPWQVAAYGATDAFANQPELVSEFETYTGIKFDEQQKELTEKYEKVLSDLEKGNLTNDAAYDEQEQRIKQRMLDNQSNDADKYYIGLALLMPLIIGGIFGKEAGLGALGGGAKGIADVLGQRQKNIRSDEESLTDIYKQRSMNAAKKGELELEKLKIPQEVKKNLPKDEFEDLKGMDIHTFKDPATGEVLGGGPEILPDLYLDLKYGNTPKKREGMQEKASKLEEEKSSLARANQATSNVIKAATQLKDPGIMTKIISYALSDDKNGALKKLVKQNAPDIFIDGRKQNAAVYLDNQIELIKDAYRRNEQMKAFTQTVAEHVGNMASNPLYEGLKPDDLIDQMLILRDRAQQFFVDRAGSQGFLKAPLEQKFGKQNKELYKSLNQKEEKKQLERDKQLMYASE